MMPSGWEIYYVVFLSALLALGVPAVLGLFSWLVATKRTGVLATAKSAGPESSLPQVNGWAGDEIQTKRINTRYFLAANAALSLIALGLLLIPCVVTLRSGASRGETWTSLVAIVSIAGFAALGLLYSARKGDLNWLRSFRRTDGCIEPREEFEPPKLGDTRKRTRKLRKRA